MTSKPSNLTPAEAALWDRMENAASGGSPAFGGPGLAGIGAGTPGMVHYLAVERCLTGAANAGLDPVAFANQEAVKPFSEWVGIGYYALLVAALEAAGFGAGLPIFDPTRPFDAQSFIAALNSLPFGVKVMVALSPATVIDWLFGFECA